MTFLCRPPTAVTLIVLGGGGGGGGVVVVEATWNRIAIDTGPKSAKSLSKCFNNAQQLKHIGIVVFL